MAVRFFGAKKASRKLSERSYLFLLVRKLSDYLNERINVREVLVNGSKTHICNVVKLFQTHKHHIAYFAGGGLGLQLFCLFYRMNDHPQSDIPKPENTGLLDQILNYIELHLSEDLSLASISAQFMVSQSTVSQLFKKQLDTGFYKIVTQRRLIESKNLINSGFPLKEIGRAHV